MGHTLLYASPAEACCDGGCHEEGLPKTIGLPLFVLNICVVKYLGHGNDDRVTLSFPLKSQLWMTYDTGTSFTHFQPLIKLYPISTPKCFVAMIVGRVIRKLRKTFSRQLQ